MRAEPGQFVLFRMGGVPHTLRATHSEVSTLPLASEVGNCGPLPTEHVVCHHAVAHADRASLVTALPASNLLPPVLRTRGGVYGSLSLP